MNIFLFKKIHFLEILIIFSSKNNEKFKRYSQSSVRIFFRDVLQWPLLSEAELLKVKKKTIFIKYI